MHCNPQKAKKIWLNEISHFVVSTKITILFKQPRLTGGAVPIAEDRSADPILDFDFDFNIGHPRLGYLGNGFHVRAANANEKEQRNSDLAGQASEQSYQVTPPLPTSYSNFQTPFVASNPRPQRDSPAALYEYQVCSNNPDYKPKQSKSK